MADTCHIGSDVSQHTVMMTMTMTITMTIMMTTMTMTTTTTMMMMMTTTTTTMMLLLLLLLLMMMMMIIIIMMMMMMKLKIIMTIILSQSWNILRMENISIDILNEKVDIGNSLNICEMATIFRLIYTFLLPAPNLLSYWLPPSSKCV